MSIFIILWYILKNNNRKSFSPDKFWPEKVSIDFNRNKIDWMMNLSFNKFDIFVWKKKRFRLRWDSSPGFSIAGAVDRQSAVLEFEPSAKTSFFPEKNFKFFKIWIYLHYLRYESLKLSTRTPVDNISYLIRD